MRLKQKLNNFRDYCYHHSLGNPEDFSSFVDYLSDLILATIKAFHIAIDRSGFGTYASEHYPQQFSFHRFVNTDQPLFCIEETLTQPDLSMYTFLRVDYPDPMECKGNTVLSCFGRY